MTTRTSPGAVQSAAPAAAPPAEGIGASGILDAAREVLEFMGAMTLGSVVGSTLRTALPEGQALGVAGPTTVVAVALGPLVAAVGWSLVRQMPARSIADLTLAQGVVVMGLWLSSAADVVAVQAAVRWVEPSLVLMVASRVVSRSLGAEKVDRELRSRSLA